MDCGGTPQGPYLSKEHDYLVKDGSLEIRNRWTANDLLRLLAKKAGIDIEVTTNRMSNLPIITGGRKSIAELLQLLDEN